MPRHIQRSKYRATFSMLSGVFLFLILPFGLPVIVFAYTRDFNEDPLEPFSIMPVS